MLLSIDLQEQDLESLRSAVLASLKPVSCCSWLKSCNIQVRKSITIPFDVLYTSEQILYIPDCNLFFLNLQYMSVICVNISVIMGKIWNLKIV